VLTVFANDDAVSPNRQKHHLTALPKNSVVGFGSLALMVHASQRHTRKNTQYIRMSCWICDCTQSVLWIQLFLQKQGSICQKCLYLI